VSWIYLSVHSGLITQVNVVCLQRYVLYDGITTLLSQTIMHARTHARTLAHTHVLVVSCIDTKYICTHVRTLKSPATAEAPPLSLQVERPRQCAAFLTTLRRRNSNRRHLLTVSVLLHTLHCLEEHSFVGVVHNRAMDPGMAADVTQVCTLHFYVVWTYVHM